MLYVWTKNYPQVVGTCSGYHGQLISQNCVLTKIRAEPPPRPPPPLIADLVYCDLFLVTNLHVLIFLHVVYLYFAFYSSILVGAVGLSQYYACPVKFRRFCKFGGGGGGGGVEEFSGSTEMRIYGGWQIFRI